MEVLEEAGMPGVVISALGREQRLARYCEHPKTRLSRSRVEAGGARHS